MFSLEIFAILKSGHKQNEGTSKIKLCGECRPIIIIIIIIIINVNIFALL